MVYNGEPAMPYQKTMPYQNNFQKKTVPHESSFVQKTAMPHESNSIKKKQCRNGNKIMPCEKKS